MKRLALVACLAVALSGCASLGVPVSSSVQTTEAKSLYVAETGFDAATLAVEAGVKAGLVKGANAQTAATYLAKAHSALLLARTAYSAGKTTDLNSALSDMASAIAQANALVKQ